VAAKESDPPHRPAFRFCSGAQAAIWDLEYGVVSTFANPTGPIEIDWGDLLAAKYANNGMRALALDQVGLARAGTPTLMPRSK
jgi:hypothetical protein